MTEIEIKFKIDDLAGARETLLLSGGEETARFFEENIVYDDRSGTLFREKCILRLRKSDRTLLTFKRPIEKGRFKVMEEREVEVSDFEGMDAILRSLGYTKVFRYQKRRRVIRVGSAAVFLDETPIGDYLEIEGNQGDIEATARLLGLRVEGGTSKNYLELYREHCAREGTEPRDMVF